MPSTLDAINFMLAQKDFYFAPAKAANAGGVGTSGLEMMQNAGMTAWSFEKVDHRLHGIMNYIFELSYETSKEFGDEGNLVLGSNIAGFRKVSDAMIVAFEGSFLLRLRFANEPFGGILLRFSKTALTKQILIVSAHNAGEK